MRFTCAASRWRLLTRPVLALRLDPHRSSVGACFCSGSRSAPAGAPNSQPSQPSATEAPDHRALGTAQELYTTSAYSPGSPLFLPNGTHILNKLQSFLRAQYLQFGFREVVTPNIYKQSLWEVSGHWQNYKDDMYEVNGRGASGGMDGEIGEDESYGLKPMNCPGHCVMFKTQTHSYRELPLRYADFSALHRNEVSGSLSGLTRVRRFHQDDGHIFCRPQQIGSEIEAALRFTDTVMRVFNLGDYRLVLSTRPEKDFIGDVDIWDSAESQLRDALNKSGRQWELNPGDGAFYGPKVDMQLQDSDGKFHQLSTIQLDLNLPQRFGLEYVVVDSEPDWNPATPGRAAPVLIHRAIFGSFERFLALLIEHHNGRWPFWLSPRQAIILTVNTDERLLRTADDIASRIAGYRIGPTDTPLSPLEPTLRVDVDGSARSLPKKIREAKQQRYNVILVLGGRNLEDGTVDVDFSGQLQAKGTAGVEALLEGAAYENVTVKQEAGVAKMKMKLADVRPWLLGLEWRFQ